MSDEPKFCVDCKHYQSDSVFTDPMCDKSPHDLVNDKPTQSCKDRRADELECGPRGWDFERGINRRPGGITWVTANGCLVTR